uniref:Group-specific protein n=1 Tax=Strongyloides stercoralis TaxID=6248 RepID=A0A0K0ERX5_STRER
MFCIEEYFQYNTEESKYGYSVTFNLTNSEQEFSSSVLNELKEKGVLSKEDIFHTKEKDEMEEVSQEITTSKD